MALASSLGWRRISGLIPLRQPVSSLQDKDKERPAQGQVPLWAGFADSQGREAGPAGVNGTSPALGATPSPPAWVVLPLSES